MERRDAELVRFPRAGRRLLIEQFKLGLFDTYHGLILVYVAFSLSFTTFFLINFFKTLPRELGEAALIDGANQYDIFFRVYLPLAKPGLMAEAIGQQAENLLLAPLLIVEFLAQPDELDEHRRDQRR